MSVPVTLPGWDARRTDDDPKYAFGRYVQELQAQGKPYNADAVRAFVQQDPRWETNGDANDPLLRVKQGVLDTWKPGESRWQDVIRDAGGVNAPQFINAGGPSPTAPAAAGSSWWETHAPSASGSVGAVLQTAPLTPALTVPGRGSVGAVLGGY